MIRKLDPLISNKIAAGEVVERPAAVVKELVENAIDAGATQISIEIKDAGKALIRVSDNGSGIAIGELPLAFERHATSKIETVEDIYCIETLGFRGEALASIASVSRVECITKAETDEAGTRVSVHGGILSDHEPVGTTQGTTFMVRDLFYNTPVRYKFLKSNQAEQTAIVDLVNKLALSHVGISFTLIVEGREAYRTDGRGKLINALLAIYGRSLIDHLIPIEKAIEGFEISGYISKPSYSRGNRNYQMLFVNGRYVKSDALQKTIFNAYKGLMTIGQFPAFALHITMPFDQVDVNIHPSKTEIRFKEPLAIEGFLFTTIKAMLMSVDLVPKSSFGGGQTPVAKQGQGQMQGQMQGQIQEKRIEQGSPLDLTIHGDLLAKLDEDFRRSDGIVSDGFQEAINKASRENDKKQWQDEPLDYTIPGDIVAKLDEDFGHNEKQSQFEGDGETENLSQKTEDLQGTQGLHGAQEIQGAQAGNGTQETNGAKDALNLGEVDRFLVEFFAKEAVKEQELAHEQISLPVTQQAKETLYDNLRIVGQLFATYIICERGQSAYLVDQHAAHERILFEDFIRSFNAHTVESQMLLAPFVYQGDVAHYAHQETAMAWLAQLGVMVESFGEREWVVRAVPIVHGEPLSQMAVVSLIDAFEEYKENVMEARFVEDVIRQSCKAAIKANHVMSHREIEALFEALKPLENPYTCPHGRPIIIEMPAKEIEKKFKRT